MRRRLAVAALAATALAGLGAAVSRRAATPGARKVSPQEIAEGVFLVPLGGRAQTNVYLVRAGTSWFLVDAGWAADAPRILEVAGRLAGPDAAPAAIILTHVHPDHAGSARALAAAWGCPVLVHPAERGIADGDFAAMERYAGPLDRRLILPVMRLLGRSRRDAIIARSSLVGVTRDLGPTGAVPGMDGWAWVATPGHTPGHVSLFRAADRVAITGDALLTLEVNTLAGAILGRQGLSGPPWYTTWDGLAAGASIQAIAELAPAVVGPGHGRPLTAPATAEDVTALATEFLGRPGQSRSRIR